LILTAEIQKRQSTSGSDSRISDQRSGSCTTCTTQNVQTRSSMTIRDSSTLSAGKTIQSGSVSYQPITTQSELSSSDHSRILQDQQERSGTRTEQKTAVPDQQTISPEQKLCNSQNNDGRTQDRQRSAGSRTVDRQTDGVQTRLKQRPVWKYHRRSVLDHVAISRRRNAAGKTADRQKILIQ